MSPIFYVCGDTASRSDRSGIQTVVRSLAAAFGTMQAPVQPVAWLRNTDTLRPLPRDWSLGLAAEALRDPPVQLRDLRHPADWPWLMLSRGRIERLPLHRHPRHRHAPPGTWVLVPELLYHDPSADRLITYVHRQGWRLAAILHDTIPVQSPASVPPGEPEIHAAYLRALSRADLILPNSHTTEGDWYAFLAAQPLPSPVVRTCTLACDLPGGPRVHAVPPPTARDPAAPTRLLCVSTIEPRKNHRSLLAAYELALARRPGLPLSLDLVGAPYAGAPDLADLVRSKAASLPGLRWHEHVEHASLQRFYARCDFTVYPSVLEGFGLPVIESLWFGRPCLCANFGVMAENAAGGGCLTTDVRDPHALASAILALAESPARRHALALQATSRPLKTWSQYAQQILDALAEQIP